MPRCSRQAPHEAHIGACLDSTACEALFFTVVFIVDTGLTAGSQFQSKVLNFHSSQITGRNGGKLKNIVRCNIAQSDQDFSLI
ncbi:N-(5'-phosphoribosyl)anthranilate isomerase 1, chloroplastic-like [Gossypium australe]|uniref:N-(5'-phosphoribosyl)anthranilate isomerase 1, chloroplastic-like n=1 Tax=Gossypium australe TaxID=47621 RepID=A0A5B6WL67_9ROSI|nr:N-(5'-phosphoribosyl)anthranilate isomerase 1, chloroplastic-like [Gossypium australe]